MSKFSTEVEAAAGLKQSFESLKKEISKVIVGQEETVSLLLTAIFCQGH